MRNTFGGVCGARKRPNRGRDGLAAERHLAWAELGGTIFRVDLPTLADRVKQFEVDVAAMTRSSPSPRRLLEELF
jgi:hypothetical protein